MCPHRLFRQGHIFLFCDKSLQIRLYGAVLHTGECGRICVFEVKRQFVAVHAVSTFNSFIPKLVNVGNDQLMTRYGICSVKNIVRDGLTTIDGSLYFMKLAVFGELKQYRKITKYISVISPCSDDVSNLGLVVIATGSEADRNCSHQQEHQRINVLFHKTRNCKIRKIRVIGFAELKVRSL